MESNGFPRFQINLALRMAFAKALDDSTEALDIIVGSGNMVPTAKIDPFHLRDQGSKFFFDHLQCALQRIRVLFTHGVEMKPFHSDQ